MFTSWILSTTQTLSYNDLLFYVILIILMFYNLTNAISKIPEDGAEEPKYVGAF